MALYVFLVWFLEVRKARDVTEALNAFGAIVYYDFEFTNAGELVNESQSSFRRRLADSFEAHEVLGSLLFVELSDLYDLSDVDISNLERRVGRVESVQVVSVHWASPVSKVGYLRLFSMFPNAVIVKRYGGNKPDEVLSPNTFARVP